MASVDRALSWLATSLLCVALSPACAHGPKRAAPDAEQGDTQLASALKEADAMEQEGRALLERGKRAEGARRMQEAFATRAEAWQEFERGASAESDGMAPRATLALRERANPGKAVEEAEEDEEASCDAELDAVAEELDCACEACSDPDAVAVEEEELDATACPFLDSSAGEIAQLREQLTSLQREIAEFRRELAAASRQMERSFRRR